MPCNLTRLEFWKLSKPERDAILHDPELEHEEWQRLHRDPRPDDDLQADIAREEQHDRYAAQGERERFGI